MYKRQQLWWGHRIPAWYCDDCGETIVSRDDITECPHCHGHVTQDPDVLDTWFSSGLWPFATMGWPEQTPELKQWYPTSVLVTGYDIIFFWVARMIFMALEFEHEIPFKHVFIHGLVRDSQGRKMSKSLGNGINPLEVIDQYGADALRFTLVTGNTPGNDMRFYMERVEANRNFANKIWNASKFVLMNLTNYDESFVPTADDLTLADQWIVQKYNETVQSVTSNLDKFELGEAASSVYDFIWNKMCIRDRPCEATTMNGTGKLALTGSLGKVMQESGQAAMSYIRHNAKALKIEDDFYKKLDIHVHLPEGATPKDLSLIHI